MRIPSDIRAFWFCPEIRWLLVLGWICSITLFIVMLPFGIVNMIFYALLIFFEWLHESYQRFISKLYITIYDRFGRQAFLRRIHAQLTWQQIAERINPTKPES